MRGRYQAMQGVSQNSTNKGCGGSETQTHDNADMPPKIGTLPMRHRLTQADLRIA
jgi:hypothetical protein